MQTHVLLHQPCTYYSHLWQELPSEAERVADAASADKGEVTVPEGERATEDPYADFDDDELATHLVQCSLACKQMSYGNYLTIYTQGPGTHTSHS